MEQHEERYWEAEIYRLRGVLLLRQTGTSQAEAETWLQQALDVARRQQAKSLELRAAMSLARLWQRQGKRGEARELLAPIYNWFTEGFDTADLQEAKAIAGEFSPGENKAMIDTPSRTLRGHFQEFFCHIFPRWSAAVKDCPSCFSDGNAMVFNTCHTTSVIATCSVSIICTMTDTDSSNASDTWCTRASG